MVSKTNPSKRHILCTNYKAVVQTADKYTQYTERNGTPKLQPSHKQSTLPILAEAIKATTTMNKNRNPGSMKTEPICNNKNIRYKGYPLFYNR